MDTSEAEALLRQQNVLIDPTYHRSAAEILAALGGVTVTAATSAEAVLPRPAKRTERPYCYYFVGNPGNYGDI